ncbi:uncharacterized protein LOC115230714 [Argonauta hians]
MPDIIMDIEVPDCSQKQVTDVLEDVHHSTQNLLFDATFNSSGNSDVFNDLPSLGPEDSKPDFGLLPSIGPLQRSPKDIESPSASNGRCGFYNLGNTCFMNAGLQCLFCNMHLIKYFHEQFVLNDLTKDTLTGKFCQLVRKVWSGHFSLIHPLDFKNTLGMYYPQFQDFRQHDCQEFVTLLLDNLHESLNNECCNNRNAFQKSLPTSSSSFSSSSAHPHPPPVNGVVTSSAIALSCPSSSASSSGEGRADRLSKSSSSSSSKLQLQNQNNSHVSSSQTDLHRTAIECNSTSTTTSSSSSSSSSASSSLSSSSPSNPTKLSGGVNTSNSSLKKAFHFTENQLYADSNNTNTNTNSTLLAVSHEQESAVVTANCPQTEGDLNAMATVATTAADRGKAQISPLRNFARSPTKDTNRMVTVADGRSGAFVLVPPPPACCPLNGNTDEVAPHIISSSSGSFSLGSSHNRAGNDPALISLPGSELPSQQQQQQPMITTTITTADNDHSQSFVAAGANIAGGSSNSSSCCSGGINRETAPPPSLALGLKCLPSLQDFYAKETKTLNTNMLASESEQQQQIKTDSEKFVKCDNRARRVNRDNCDNSSSSSIEEMIGAEGAKAELSPGIEKLKDINIRLDKKARCHHQNYPCPSGLPYEDWSNINKIKRIKIESDVDEKNVKRHALHKFNLEHSTLRTDEVMATPGCSATADDEEDEEEEDDEEEEEAMSGGEECVVERQDGEWLREGGERQAGVGQGSNSTRGSSSLPAEHCGLPEGLTAADVDAANVSWENHLVKNNSVVVSTFHGQFKNTVICSECCHVSVTYEPFMYLSVPIPHAMERQLCVIFITQTRTIPPTRYLLKLHKNDNISKAKTELGKLSAQQNCDILMVEVVNNHICRILDDNILLRFVNDSARKIYAYQMVAPPSSQDSATPPEVSLGEPPALNSTSTVQESNAAKSSDIFSNMNIFSPGSSPKLDTPTKNLSDPNISVQSDESDMVVPSNSPVKPVTPHAPLASARSLSTSELNDSSAKDNVSVCSSPTVSSQSKSSDSLPDPMHIERIWDWTVSTENAKKAAIPMSWEPVAPVNLPSVAEHWRSCAICLEELLDTSLMVHTSCAGTFCHGCLQMSLKHHSVFSYTCPVCLAFVNPSVEFVPLADPDSKRLRTRILAVPLIFRCSSKSDPGQQQLIGHPHILYLPNNISGSTLYHCVDQLLNTTTLSYTIAFTMEEGLQCSRCPSVSQCAGCVVQRSSKVTLQPGDHLSITFGADPKEIVEQCVIDHESMEDQRPNTPMSLYDCFTAFMQSETLDEHNPWYCPNCSKNCRAKKTMTVWRYPDNLIIYLKRFVFHELTSTKIDNLVTFPLEDLDLGQFISGPHSKNLLYDLHSFVCHFGGSNSGHYTCYSKHPTENNWYYYNDENVSQHMPRDDHLTSAYVLFYVRQDSNISFKVPDKSSYHFIDSLSNGSTSLTDSAPNIGRDDWRDESMALVLYQPQPMHADSTLYELPKDKDSDISRVESSSPIDQTEPDSTYDFYS